MRQCELEKVVREKGDPKFKRTGEKMVSFIDKITVDMVGSIIDLKKVEGFWVVNSVYEQDIEMHKINRNWHVGGL